MKKALLIGLCIIAIIAAVAIICYMQPVRRVYLTDADTIKQPVETAIARDILWQPPAKLPTAINTGADDYEPRLSWDGLSLFFVRGKAGENADIYVCCRTPDGWTEPTPIAAVNGKYDDLGPEPSADGRSLYFYSNRPGGSGGYDLWVSYKGEGGWQEPGNLGPRVNSEFNDYGPTVTSDGKTLYFASNRPQPQDTDEPNPDAWPATVREDLYQRDYDLYMTVVTDSGVGEATAIAELNTEYNEGAPAVSPVGDFLYFGSDRPGGEGGFDVYRSRRLRGTHREPTNLGDAVNTAANELDPGLTTGGYALYFSSDRPARRTNTDKPNDYNLYQTTSREVFRDVEEQMRAAIDWWGLWSQIGPNLLLALLALLLLLLLLRLFNEARLRKLSLLAKCLIASLLAHAMLLFLFNFWEVSAALAGMLGRHSAIQVALVPSTGGSEIASQIRGDFTRFDTPPPQETAVERRSETLSIRQTVATAVLNVERLTPERVEKPAMEVTPDEAEARLVDASIPAPALSWTGRPMRVDLVVPDETPRVQSTEAVLQIQNAAANPRPVDRADMDAATTAPVDHYRTVDFNPHQSDRDASASVDARFADASSRHDATPSFESRDSAAELAFIEHHSPVDVDLPAIAKAGSDNSTESALQAPSATTDTPRRTEAVDALAATATAPMSFLKPQSPGTAPGGTTMVSPTEDELSDAALTYAATDSIDNNSAIVTSPPASDVALPSLEEAAAAATPETRPRFASMDTRSPGRVPFTEPTNRDVEHELARLDPTLKVGLQNEATLVARDQDEVSDMAVRSSDVVTPSLTVVASSIPALTGFTLPPLNEAELSFEKEATSPPPASVDLKSTRESLPPLAPHDVKPASVDVVAFAPTADVSVRRMSRSLADVLPRHRDDDHRSNPATDLPVPNEARIEPGDALALKIALPPDVEPPENPYKQRSPGQRTNIVRTMGGSERTESAVALALDWLARHQSEDGHWDGDEFDARCGGCGGETDITADIALTGLSLLCFLGADHTHAKDGPYQSVVERGVSWLVDRQEPDGDLRGEETMYSHAIAAIAISEAYAMTGDPRLLDKVRRAVAFIHEARNTRVGGWRYDPGQVGDTSVLGWQVMALKSAQMAGIEVPYESLNCARAWLDRVSKPTGSGLYAYQPNRRPTPAMTAESMFAQQLLGRRRDEPRMRESAALLIDNLPDWHSQPNTYYWYYATLALYQHQGKEWKRWNDVLTRQLIKNQHRSGPNAGSWDPVGEWADLGGRVYQTALCTLMLEVYYRYLPLYNFDQKAAPDDAIGMIRGRVVDAETGRPLPGATVRLDLPDRPPVTARTGIDGAYVMFAPRVPDFFALSASKDGYVPKSANVPAAQLEGTTLMLDFHLEAESKSIVAVEEEPELHHLGNNRFEGRINSQFQRESEGRAYLAQFDLDETQVAPFISSVEIHLLAKGVQCPAQIRINDTLIDARLDGAPADGSFGEFSAEFDPSLLHEGANTVLIRTISCRGDLDDFEFVNVQFRLAR